MVVARVMAVGARSPTKLNDPVEVVPVDVGHVSFAHWTAVT